MAGKGKGAKGKKKLKHRKQGQKEKADGFAGNNVVEVQDGKVENNEELGTGERPKGNNGKSEKSDVLGNELLDGIKITSSDHLNHNKVKSHPLSLRYHPLRQRPSYPSSAKIPTNTPSAEESAFIKVLTEARLANTPVHTPECGHPNLRRDIDDCAAMQSLCWNLQMKGGSYELIKLNCEKLLDCYEEDKIGYPYILKKAFKYIKEHNVKKDVFYPSITRSDVKLHKITEEVEALRISGFQMVDNKDEAALITALNNGTIIGGVRESPEFTMLGKKIYRGSDYELVVDGKYCNHALNVMGYDTDKRTGTNYWIVLNSELGSRWGNGGEGRVARDSSLTNHRKHLLTTTMIPIFE